MTEFTLGYREVITDQDLVEKWTEITLTTGGTQSTLQDIKATEKAGGYSYTNSSKYYTRNRFIYWRINADYLELIEHSLDINLTGNKVRYRFVDSPIIDGISIEESADNVFVLVPTVCSVHKLTFPHPSKFHRQDEILGSQQSVSVSIFSKASSADARNPATFHVFINPSTAIDQLPNLASSFYDSQKNEALFILSYPSCEILLIKLNQQGQASCSELKGESIMPKFLSGLAEKFSKKHKDGNQVLGLLILDVEDEVYGLTLLRNGVLKFWSCRDGQCEAAIDVLSEYGETGADRLQSGFLRKCEQTDYTRLAILFCFTDGCQFHIVKPVFVSDQLQIRRLNALTSMENNLIDFSIQSNRIWAAWRSSDESCVVYTASIKSGIWTPIVREGLHETEAPQVSDEKDPRQVYLQHLFHPGRFPLHIINKALESYRKSNLMDTEVNLTSVADLKQAICLVIESSISSCFKENEVTDEEYLDYSEWCWQKFYSFCIQYHQNSSRPLGLMLMSQSSGAILLKKATISYLRPMEALEHMFLCNNYVYKDQFINFALMGEEDDLVDDEMVLFETLVFIEEQLGDTFKSSFEEQLAVSLKPNVVIKRLLKALDTELEFEYKDLCDQITNKLSEITDLYRAIHKLLELLRSDTNPSNPDNKSSITTCFGSTLGTLFLGASLRQQCANRFAICRNLLIVCDVLIDSKSLQTNVSEAVNSVCKPEIIYLTQACYVMLWLTKLPALDNTPQTEHNSIQQRLSSLKLTPAVNLEQQGTVFSLLELFISSTGGAEGRTMLSKADYNGDIMAHWHLSLLPLVSNLRQIIWPLKNGTLLPEWLVSSGQHVWLQQYVRMLGNWCDWNISSCSFLLGVSFLASAENYKALNSFEMAADNICNEPFLQRLIGNEQGVQGLIMYYLKVIQLFEIHKARDCAIQIANTALSIGDADHPLNATLYSIKFVHHLALKQYDDAFYALKSNPDIERKKDNLRDLVKNLLDERRFDVLLGFTYAEMDELFNDILLTKARAIDPLDNVYYDFLYAYQIKRGPLCHRLAASVMYEQAYRLFQFETIEALEKQVKCLLAAKNMLVLVEDRYAWVLRPADPDAEPEEIVLEPLAGSNKEGEKFLIKKTVEVVDVEIITRELRFSSAKLKLARYDPSLYSDISDGSELIQLLSNAGLFKTALEFCRTIGYSCVPIFEGLSFRCAELSEKDDPGAWNWLAENDLQDLTSNREDSSLLAWELLQNLLKEYEEENSTELHKVVTRKIIAMEMFLPMWLTSSYKLRNPTEFLRLLHLSGRLDEAYEVCQGYVLAALGYGKELYGIKTSLTPSTPESPLPVYAVQALITEFEMQNQASSDEPFKEEYETLKGLFEKYLSILLRVSNERCRLEMPTFGSMNTSRITFS